MNEGYHYQILNQDLPWGTFVVSMKGEAVMEVVIYDDEGRVIHEHTYPTASTSAYEIKINGRDISVNISPVKIPNE